MSATFPRFSACMLAASILMLASGPLRADDSYVLKTNKFEVVEQDLYYYLTDRAISEEDAARMLANENAIRDIFANIYVIRAFAERAVEADEGLLTDEELQWRVEHYRDRLLMARQLGKEVAEELAKADWEALAREEYLAKQENFVIPEQVSVSHILVSTADRSEEEARIRAEEISDRLAAGEDFESLVQEYSDDETTVPNQGRLGLFGRGRMVAPFEDAAFALEEPGDVSQPVLSEFGYHIIRLDDRKEESVAEFDLVKERLMADIRQRREEAVRGEKISEVKNGRVDLGLEVNTELLEEIEARYAVEDNKAALRELYSQ